MANPTCTRDSFISGSSCFKNLNSHDRQALMVYLLAKELAALGGTDYTSAFGPGGTLNSDAAEFKTMSEFELELAQLVIEKNNAVAAGAEISSNIQTIMDEIKCLKNFNEPTLSRMWLLLMCKLGVHKAYPQ